MEHVVDVDVDVDVVKLPKDLTLTKFHCMPLLFPLNNFLKYNMVMGKAIMMGKDNRS